MLLNSLFDYYFQIKNKIYKKLTIHVPFLYNISTEYFELIFLKSFFLLSSYLFYMISINYPESVFLTISTLLKIHP